MPQWPSRNNSIKLKINKIKNKNKELKKEESILKEYGGETFKNLTNEYQTLIHQKSGKFDKNFNLENKKKILNNLKNEIIKTKNRIVNEKLFYILLFERF